MSISFDSQWSKSRQSNSLPFILGRPGRQNLLSKLRLVGAITAVLLLAAFVYSRSEKSSLAAGGSSRRALNGGGGGTADEDGAGLASGTRHHRGGGSGLLGSQGSSKKWVYPRTAPVRRDGAVKFRIGLVADLDQGSKHKDDDEWVSYYVKGYLVYHENTGKYSVEMDASPAKRLTSRYAEKGRGMELSELIYFQGHLYTVDDRTGIVFELLDPDADADAAAASADTGSTGESLELGKLERQQHQQQSQEQESVAAGLSRRGEDRIADYGRIFKLEENHFQSRSFKPMEVVPRFILGDGPGTTGKGFKSEWATVKDGRLYIGGLGKEWTTGAGVVLHNHPQWVKVIDEFGTITHVDWESNYNALREQTGTSFPGYMIHESAAWSSQRDKWFFLPRRASSEPYDEVFDEIRGTNWLLSCSESFKDVSKVEIGYKDGRRGFSSFKFVPFTDENEIVALKTEEVKGKLSTYMSVFSVYGEILMPDTLIAQDAKFEGVEFV